MRTTYLLPALAGLILLCGCDKQTRANTEKIEMLSRQLVRIQQNQALQLDAMQSQLAALAPMLTQTNSYYFTKSYENALFFHTNTLYLLLTISKNIEEQLHFADTEREAAKALLGQNHTNLKDAIFFCTSQITGAIGEQEKRLQENINAETKRVGATWGDTLVNQIKSSAPDKAEAAKRAKLEADVAQIQRDLDAIKTALGITNQPPAPRP